MVEMPEFAYQRARNLRSRAIIAAKRLGSVHPTSYITMSCRVAPDLVAEEYVFAGPECVIGPGTKIGRYTLLAARVAVIGDDHVSDRAGVPMQFSGRPAQRSTHIGRDVWLGHGVIVMRGITIGDGSIVGAGAVVTKDVPSYEVWAGVPAARVRARFEDAREIAEHRAMIDGPVVEPSFARRQRMRAAEQCLGPGLGT